MIAVTVFGVLAVSTMMVAYALQDRFHSFVLVFAIASLSASVYALLIEAWPFAVIEALWSAVAIRKWNDSKASCVG